ncbi:PRTRC system protein E [Sphingobium sp. Leaf26]|uniref:PRTRC system protein E n=1 Tax=Sphingobium sp. Leaf26 TaxID=1735693 RepID=UPI0006F6CD1C|nr:PRTRC system protein E [Sphingobium sp. Leaf26]KQN09844.1 PRTRC system protein E [Sphingobium sp. Leaf26]
MLITSLLPLLSRYSLGLDLVAGPDGTVTLTIIPRKAAGAKHDPEGGEVRPISITATAAEIDEELAKGTDGALGQLIGIRKALGDQLAEQRAAAEAAKTAAKPKKTETAAAKAPPPAAPPATPEPAAEPKPGEPASLY